MRVPILLAAAAVVSTAYAANETITDFDTSPVEWVYPPTRGFAADTASVYPCGGIDPSASRTSYPISGGEIALQSQILASNINILYVNETDPTLFHDFSTYTSTVLDMSVGDYCVAAPDFSDYDYSAGENVTLLVIYQFYGNETYYYTCADLTLVENSDYTAPSTTCTNSSIILDVAASNDSLVLDGENFSADAAGGDGQTISITSTPTAEASTTAAASTASAAATSSAAAASSSTSTSTSTSAGMPKLAGGALGAVIGTVLLTLFTLSH